MDEDVAANQKLLCFEYDAAGEPAGSPAAKNILVWTGQLLPAVNSQKRTQISCCRAFAGRIQSSM
jgi:hypothetical protein